MYLSHTAADHRVNLGLPPDYTVDGVIAYGTWDLVAEEEQLPHLRRALGDLGLASEISRMEHPLIGHAYEILVDGTTRHWYIPVMGTAVMGMYLHIASVLGSRRNILLGTVGGLAPGMSNGDLVIPTGAIGNDSARMYDRGNHENLHLPDASLLRQVTDGLSETEDVWIGPTTTCEMMLAESEDDVRRWSSEGMLGVEMEGALAFALSRHFGIPSVALFYVIDNLIAQETVLSAAHESYGPVRELRRALQYRIGLELLTSGAVATESGEV